MASPLVKVICLECKKKFRVREFGEECPRCGGTDIGIREEESCSM